VIAEDAVSNTHLPRHRLRVWGDYQLDGGVNGEPRNLTLSLKGKHRTPSCRSELAREKLTDAACTQEARVIVDVFREQELGVPLAPTKKSLVPLQKLFFAGRQIPRFVPTLQKAIIDSRLF
jgi:hypothetical protein